MLDLDNLIQKCKQNRYEVTGSVYQAIKTEKTKWISAENALPYNDAVEIAIIKKLISQCLDLVKQFELEDRCDLVIAYVNELAILRDLLSFNN